MLESTVHLPEAAAPNLRRTRSPKLDDVALTPSSEDSISLKSFGIELYDGIFKGLIAARFGRELTRRHNGPLPIRIDLPRESIAHNLPWEAMYDRDRGFLALDRATPIIRQGYDTTTKLILGDSRKLRIVVIGGNARGFPHLNIAREFRLLRFALKEQIEFGVVDLVFLHDASLNDLLDELRKPEPIHVLHFVGHGEYDKIAGTGTIILPGRH